MVVLGESSCPGRESVVLVERVSSWERVGVLVESVVLVERVLSWVVGEKRLSWERVFVL